MAERGERSSGPARPALRLELPGGAVRSYLPGDAEALARHADDREVWQGLRDAFPYPYRLEDARLFIDRVLASEPETLFAIDLGGEAVGGIGFTLFDDVERISAEVGYWLGRAFWGRGVATAALRAVSAHALASYELTRLFAVPFATNRASVRVLEKAGFALEGRMRRSAIKEGRVVDQLLYALVVDREVRPPP